MTLAPPVTKLLDVVYPVRPGDSNEELRYALRTLEANFPHAKVWIAGYKPAWVTNVEYLPGNDRSSPRANLYWNILNVCRIPELSDDIVLMNDDFLLTAPVMDIPILYRGLLRDHIAMPRVQRGHDWWRESLQTTLTCLQAHGIREPLSYELHTPFVVNRHLMAETLELFQHVTPGNPPQWRTLYGNLHNIGGTQSVDGKAYRPGPVAVPFHSTDDSSWRYFAPHFRKTFPTACRYEAQS